MKQRITAGVALVAIVVALIGVSAAVTANEQSTVFDQLDLLVDVRHELVSNYVEDPNQQELVQAAVRGMVESLSDPYTTYLTTEDLEMFDHYVRGSFSGIGAEVDTYEDRLRIVTPLEESPAWKAGVLAGDIVLEIDGQSTLNMPLSEAIQKLTGEPGTQVTLRVRHESGEEQTIVITRAVINIQTVRGFQRDADQHFDFLLDHNDRIGYIRITQFSERTAEELQTALRQLIDSDARALVLDVRFNPGGLLEAAVSVSDMFLTGGKTIVSVEGRVVPKQVYSSTDETIISDIPVVILANEASASAAEILTGALKDNDRALFIGTRTFGKGSVQQVRMLESGQGALKMTNAYYYIPSGRLIHRRDDSTVWGVDPSANSYVPMSPEQVRDMVKIRRESDRVRPENGANDNSHVTAQWIEENLKDPQLAAALRAVRGKLESNDWPNIGQSNADELVKANKRANLIMRRDLLNDRLKEINAELAALNGEGNSTATTAPVTEDTAKEPVDVQAPAEQVTP